MKTHSMKSRSVSYPFVFDCKRTKIEDKDERKMALRFIRQIQEDNDAYRYSNIHRRGSWLSPALHVVCSRNEGIPFVEAVLEKVNTRPFLAIGKEIDRNGTKYWLALVEKVSGNDKISELSVEESENAWEIIAAFSNRVLDGGGKVYDVNDSLPESCALMQGGFYVVSSDDGATPENSAPIYPLVIDRSKSKILCLDKSRQEIPSTPLQSVVVLAFVCVFILVGYSMFTQKEEEKIVEKKNVQYQEFEDAFYNGYSPKAGLYEVYKLMVGKADSSVKFGLRDSVPGWNVTSIEVTPKNIVAKADKIEGGMFQTIQQAAAQMNAATLTLSHSQIAVVKETKPRCKVPVAATPELMPIEGISNYVVTAFQYYLPQATVKFGQERKKTNFSVRDVTVTLDEVSVETVDLVGTYLNMLPIDLRGASFTVEGGLLNGTINLQFIGCSLGDVGPDGLCKVRG